MPARVAARPCHQKTRWKMDGVSIETEEQLESLLSGPSARVIETLAALPGDILLLGVAGKMGPSLARMAKRASDAAGIHRRILGVARFSEGGEKALHEAGIEAIRCDLLNEADLERLPASPNVMFL